MATKKFVIKADGSKGKVGVDSGFVFNEGDERADKYVQAIKNRNAILAGEKPDLRRGRPAEADDDGSVERVSKK